VHFSGVAEYFYSGDGGFSAETVQQIHEYHSFINAATAIAAGQIK
jgi:hypothetical protein